MTIGFLVVDKPAGLTSHDVVATVRAVTGVRKVGHTGTLDPFATGVLPLALGPATRLVRFLDESIKVYDATIALGSATDTGDPTGEVIQEAPLPEAEAAEVRAVLQEMIGPQQQAPPAYSAVKVRGKRMYKYARQGEKVEAQPRPIEIHDLELTAWDRRSLQVRITCSRGTYARVLADDIAIRLGSRGHLSALVRPRSGPFFLEDALSLPKLAERVAAEPGHDWRRVLLSRRPGERVKWRPRSEVLAALKAHLRSPLDALAHLPLCDVRPSDARRVRHGGAPPPPPGGVGPGDRYAVVCGAELIAIAESSARGPRLVRVIPASRT